MILAAIDIGSNAARLLISEVVKHDKEIEFNKLNLNYEDFVKQDQKFVRKEELEFLKGDSSKTRKLLNWKPEISFEEMIDEMIDCWMKKI